MHMKQHIRRTKKLVGVKGADIHDWIDGLFDHRRWDAVLISGNVGDFDPYEHRRHRHCQEAVEECVEEFRDKYPEDAIRQVFEVHVRDDYLGYFPCRADFDDPEFLAKYHSL